MPFQILIRGIFTCAALFFAVACNPIGDYDYFATVQGVVSDYRTGEPVSGANVRIMPGNQAVVSDVNGCFEFTDLDPMQYAVTVQKTEYQTNRKIVDAVAGETVRTIVFLHKITE